MVASKVSQFKNKSGKTIVITFSDVGLENPTISERKEATKEIQQLRKDAANGDESAKEAIAGYVDRSLNRGKEDKTGLAQLTNEELVTTGQSLIKSGDLTEKGEALTEKGKAFLSEYGKRQKDLDARAKQLKQKYKEENKKLEGSRKTVTANREMQQRMGSPDLRKFQMESMRGNIPEADKRGLSRSQVQKSAPIGSILRVEYARKSDREAYGRTQDWVVVGHKKIFKNKNRYVPLVTGKWEGANNAPVTLWDVFKGRSPDDLSVYRV